MPFFTCCSDKKKPKAHRKGPTMVSYDFDNPESIKKSLEALERQKDDKKTLVHYPQVIVKPKPK